MTTKLPDCYLLPFEPSDIPDLVSFWNFTNSGERFTAVSGEPYTLVSQTGELSVEVDEAAPFGGCALDIKHGNWLNISRDKCPRLDKHGNDSFTLMVWIKRRKSASECEFVAGQWNESDGGRQYGLFFNISVWGENGQVCGHLSNVGGATPGYKYCIDGPVGSTPVEYDSWGTVAMSFDGTNGYAWLNGKLDVRPGLNPYVMDGGLFDGGPNGSDFTVGAVDRSGEIGNFFDGQISAMAFYDRALTAAEIYALDKK